MSSRTSLSYTGAGLSEYLVYKSQLVSTQLHAHQSICSSNLFRGHSRSPSPHHHRAIDKPRWRPERVVPTKAELGQFDLNDAEVIDLIHHAQESDAIDRKLTVREALKKYKKAVFWAMFLSTSLIMEGYDLVIVRTRCS